MSIFANAQTICHTPQVSSQQLMKRYMFKSKSTNDSIYLLRVYFHVMRKSDGTGGHSSKDVYDSFNILNRDFNSHGIYFIWNGNIDYIDDSSKYYYPNSNIFTYNNHQDGIDIYLFPDEVNEGYEGGLANGVGNSSELYVGGLYWKSPYPSLATSHVVSHEMGHVLGLWHTHHGTMYEGGDANQCAELVDGSNSDTCGDYIEDTPADPHLNFNVNPITCQWLGSGQDANGDNYAPDTRLIMSYTDIRCMDYFSAKQGERMKDAVSTLSHLQSCIVGPTIIGPSSLCDTNDYSITNLPTGSNVSWNLLINGDSTAAQLSVNTPGINQCQISRTGSQYESFTATLTATVIYQNDTITVLSKDINAPAQFVSVPYTIINTQGSGGTGGMVGSYNNIDIKPNTMYYLSSLYFMGKSPSIQGSPIPGSYMFTPSGISGYNVMVPQGGNLIAQFSDGCISTTWSFWGNSSVHLMSISGGDGQLNIEITKNDSSVSEVTEYGSKMESSENLADLEWMLEVYEASSFRKVKTVDVRGSSYTLDTSSLPKGIYIIRAIIGKEILSEKITIN